MTDQTETQAVTVEPRPEPTTAPAAKAIATMPTGPLDFFGDGQSFVVGQRMATMLASASIVPDTYRSQYPDKNGVWVENADAVSNCFIALELANRLRVSPLMIMQQVDMIHGRPALRGTLLIGLINGSREFLDDLDFECNAAQGDEYGYRAYTRRKSDGKTLYGPWITWKMVKGEKWCDKTGSKWKTMPELMFQYRAAAFWSRLFASHITLGLYESEEAKDFLEGDFEQVPTRAQLLDKKLADAEQNAGSKAGDAEAGADAGVETAGKAAEIQTVEGKPKKGTRRAIKPKPEPAPEPEPDATPPADENTAAPAQDEPPAADAKPVQQSAFDVE